MRKEKLKTNADNGTRSIVDVMRVDGSNQVQWIKTKWKDVKV